MTTINELDEMIQRHPVCSVATLEGNQPRLRMFWTWFVDDEGLYFHTPKKGMPINKCSRITMLNCATLRRAITI